MGVSPGELRITSCKQEFQDVAVSLDQRPPTFALVWVTGSQAARDAQLLAARSGPGIRDKRGDI
jgi:hypothetical protein